MEEQHLVNQEMLTKSSQGVVAAVFAAKLHRELVHEASQAVGVAVGGDAHGGVGDGGEQHAPEGDLGDLQEVGAHVAHPPAGDGLVAPVPNATKNAANDADDNEGQDLK